MTTRTIKVRACLNCPLLNRPHCNWRQAGQTLPNRIMHSLDPAPRALPAECPLRKESVLITASSDALYAPPDLKR